MRNYIFNEAFKCFLNWKSTLEKFKTVHTVEGSLFLCGMNTTVLKDDINPSSDYLPESSREHTFT